MKNYKKIVLLFFITVLSYLNGSSQIAPSKITTGYLFAGVAGSEIYDNHYSDDIYCFRNLDWMRRYANVQSLEALGTSDLPSSKLLLSKVRSKVRSSQRGKVILSDFTINTFKDDAFKNALLILNDDQTITDNSGRSGSPLKVERLTYFGMQLPAITDYTQDITIHFDEDLIMSNLREEYVINISDSRGHYDFSIKKDDSFTVPVGVLIRSSWIINIYTIKGEHLVTTCFTFDNDPYDPTTLVFPDYSPPIKGGDVDRDGVIDLYDNCPTTFNPDQSDIDFDGIGNVCDQDSDNDGILDHDDNCVYKYNPKQKDDDNDGVGNSCMGNEDSDVFEDDVDDCLQEYNPFPIDTDGDGTEDICDDDIDGDGILNSDDWCPMVYDPSNADIDGDMIGDICDDDIDGDDIVNDDDLCPEEADPSNTDTDGDGIGDVCDDVLDPEVHNDCLIQPTLTEIFDATQTYTVGPASENPDFVINDLTDLQINASNGTPGVSQNMFGTIKAGYYIHPDRNKVKKPIILTDGIDFTNTSTIQSIAESFGGNNLVQLMWNNGYDLIIVDFIGGADFIQRNGFALQDFIKKIKVDNGLSEIPAIIGPSMGGQVVRFALLDWEANKKQLPEWGDHNIKTFLSVDSQWEGANAGVAVQSFASQFENVDFATTVTQFLNTPAARQLLLSHYNESNTQLRTIFPSFSFYENQPSPHSFRDRLVSDFNSLGNTPKDLDYLIAIADGSGNGISQNEHSSNASPDEIYLKLKMTIDINNWPDKHPEVWMKGVKDNHFFLYGNNDFNELKDEILGARSLSGSQDIDSAPGSAFDLERLLPNNIPNVPINQWKGFLGIDLIEIRQAKDIELFMPDEHQTFCFTPTFSALGVTGADPFTNFDAIKSAGPISGFTVPGSPFDAVLFDNLDSEHVGFSNGGDLAFMFSYIEGGEGDYTQCEHLDDIIEASSPSPLFDQYVDITCDNPEAVLNGCVAQQFGNSNVSTTATQVSGEENVEITVQPGGIIVNLSSFDEPELDYAIFEICQTVNLGACSEQYCQNFIVNIDLTSCDDDWVIASSDVGDERQIEQEKSSAHREEGIHSKDSNDEIYVFPNPSDGSFILSNTASGNLEVYDMSGRIVFRKSISSSYSRINLEVPAGIYILRFVSDSGLLYPPQKIFVE